MRLRLPIGAVPLLSLAALAARAEDPVADPGRVRISYEPGPALVLLGAGARCGSDGGRRLLKHP